MTGPPLPPPTPPPGVPPPSPRPRTGSIAVVVIVLCIGGIAMGALLAFGADELFRFIGREIVDSITGD